LVNIFFFKVKITTISNFSLELC